VSSIYQDPYVRRNDLNEIPISYLERGKALVDSCTLLICLAENTLQRMTKSCVKIKIVSRALLQEIQIL